MALLAHPRLFSAVMCHKQIFLLFSAPLSALKETCCARWLFQLFGACQLQTFFHSLRTPKVVTRRAGYSWAFVRCIIFWTCLFCGWGFLEFFPQKLVAIWWLQVWYSWVFSYSLGATHISGKNCFRQNPAAYGYLGLNSKKVIPNKNPVIMANFELSGQIFLERSKHMISIELRID